jgi:hypothetical protein
MQRGRGGGAMRRSRGGCAHVQAAHSPALGTRSCSSQQQQWKAQQPAAAAVRAPPGEVSAAGARRARAAAASQRTRQKVRPSTSAAASALRPRSLTRPLATSAAGAGRRADLTGGSGAHTRIQAAAFHAGDAAVQLPCCPALSRAPPVLGAGADGGMGGPPARTRHNAAQLVANEGLDQLLARPHRTFIAIAACLASGCSSRLSPQ